MRRPYEEGEGPVIHIHEDDWGMRNLYPLTVRAEVARDLDAAAGAAERNRDPSGFGWSEMHMIEVPATSYVEAGLSVAQLAEAVAPHLPRVKRFYATIGSAMGADSYDPLGAYEEEAWCLGLGPHCYVKADVEGELVKYVWFGFDELSAAEAAALRAALRAIDALVPSFIADYFMDAEIVLSDDAALDRYFAEREAQIERVNQMIREEG